LLGVGPAITNLGCDHIAIDGAGTYGVDIDNVSGGPGNSGF
jgi:hypothetical protein